MTTPETAAPPAFDDPDLLRETAAAHMVREIPRATRETTVDDALAALRGRHFACADTVFVTEDGGRLAGIVRLNDLLSAPGSATLGSIMEPEHDAVAPGDDQEQVALLAMNLRMIAVPVVDDAGRLIGAVPPEVIIAVMRREHMEDLQRIAGIQRHDPPAPSGLQTSIADRLRRRLPWLVAGLAASSAATAVVAGFEETLARHVRVSFFVPALVYIAGAIGAQAVSVAVRALAMETVAVGRMIRDELAIGLMIGLLLGLATLVPVWAVFGDHRLALSVGIAVMGAGTVSAVVGFGLPWLFQRMGFDPALGSGPICTIIQDVASLLIYFAVVSALMM